MIPKHIHQIWVGPNKIPKREAELSHNLSTIYSDYEYWCWSDSDVDAVWDMFSPIFQSEYQRMYAAKRYAWCADILRVWIIHQYGGIYLDIDFEVINRFPDEWLEHDGIVFYHRYVEDCHNGEMSNSMIGGISNLPILHYCLSHMVDGGNCWYGPSWFGTCVKTSIGMTNKYTNEELLKNLKRQNILGVCFEDVHGEYLHHHGLYSWSDNYIPEKEG